MMGESFEDDEWEDDFVEQLVKAEELALSTQRSHHPPPPLPPLMPPPPPPLMPPPPRAPLCGVTHSPPRELSQRTHETYHTGDVPDSIGSFGTCETHCAKEQENDRLKRELHGVSKQLHQLEEEILELRKERDQKEEQLKALHLKIEAKDAEFKHSKNAEIPTAPGISTEYQNGNPSNNQLGSSSIRSSEKLFRLWNSDDQKQGKGLVAKLFMTCEAEFLVLFGYLNSPEKGSDKGTDSILKTAKVSQLYSVLTKLQISTNTLIVGDLLGALADLCSLKNVEIVRSSICILHNVLSNSFTMENKFGKRENVIVEEQFSDLIKSDTDTSGDTENESLCLANVTEMLKQGQMLSGLELFNVKTPGHTTGFFDRTSGTSISGVFWVSIFETMCVIASENNEEQIRREALSIMNLILARQNAYSDRDKFAGELVFRSLSQLLRREAGFSVQDRAVHTLYLLCNCPKVIHMLCSDVEEDGERACSKDNNDKSSSPLHWLNEILIGLADCIACYGSSSADVKLNFQKRISCKLQDVKLAMKLRRNALTFLVFVVSAGKFGFEILLNHKLPKGNNFPAIILQSLTSDLDPQALNSAKQSGIVKEQCLLIREALIFLNRLVSHPDYALLFLQSLTSTREMASTAVDVANRLTHNSNLLWKDISSKTHIRESEIVDLARVFKMRVFTFLRDNIS